MKKTTQNLSKRLAQYGALSVAIAGITRTNGQIIYSGPIDLGGADYIIDLNNDTINDFKIIYIGSQNVLRFQDYSSNQVLGSIVGPYQYPFALDNNTIINSSQNTWMNDSFQILNWNSCAFPNNNWCNVTDKYLGLRFKVLNGPGPGDDQTFYGWARINVPLDPSGWIIKDFAYNSTPDAPINAGQLTLGIEDNVFSKIKVVPLNKSIGLYNLPETANFNIYSMAGQEVLKGSTENIDYVIEATALSSGVYVLELTDTNSKVVIRKKVVLQ